MTTQSDPSADSSGESSIGSGFFSNSSVWGHLSELSMRLKRSLIAYIVALALVSSLPDPFHPFGGSHAFYGYNFLLTDLIRMAEAAYAPNYQFFSQSPSDPVFAFLNVSMVLALVVSLPYIFYEIYGFVAPGLYRREKKVVRKYVLPFSVLMTAGGLFGLLVVFPVVMHVLLLFYSPLGLESLISIDSFVGLLILIPLITGLAFTFPVFLIPLVELKVLSAKQLSRARLWIYLIVALGVSIANPDPTDISSIPIVVPIIILFEITILVAKRIESNRAKKVAPEEKVRRESGSSMP